MTELVLAIDQGTSSTRVILFDRHGAPVVVRQREHRQLLPRPGWVEHDPVEIWDITKALISDAVHSAGPAEIVAVGIANQRETTVIWNCETGEPYANAVVWQDVRAQSIVDALLARGDGPLVQRRTGLRPAAYFSGGKLRWLLDHTPGLRADAERGVARFGTMDSWLTWNLTGAVSGGRHVTDVTNASRSMLMDLRTLDWDEDLLSLFGVPRSMLPQIRPSSDPTAYGRITADNVLAGVPIAGVLGDQQAALFGQGCVGPGDAKCTYGTGNFVLLNTGTSPVPSRHGLLTTVAYQLAGRPPVYALEGSVAVTGAAVQWLRDQLGIIESAADAETLAASVPDSAGVYFVPAFSGLFAPYWRSDARGVLTGLTAFSRAAHIARATLEAICYQTRAVVDAMAADSGHPLTLLKADGGVTTNSLCMQLQADILGVPVSVSSTAEATALGAAYAAGLAVGFWASKDDLLANASERARWAPSWPGEQRGQGYAGWQRAVERSAG